MLTTSQTDYLLSLPKYVVNKDGDKMDVVTVDIDAFYDHRILLQVVNERFACSLSSFAYYP